jgi:O-methyltransferase
MAAWSIKNAAKQLVKPIARRVTASLYAERPLASWPPLMGRIHEITVPHGVVPHAKPMPIGSANINNLIALIEKTRDIPGDIAECGVYRGQSLVPMAIYLSQQKIAKTIYGFDSFEGFADSIVDDLRFGGTKDEWKQPGLFNDTSYKCVVAKAKTFGLKNIVLVKGFFNKTLPAYSSHRFSFVHLDCDAYDAYKECLNHFYPGLSAGAIISFDEYNDPPWPGCNHAVNEFLADKPEQLQVIALDNYEKYYLVKQ